MRNCQTVSPSSSNSPLDVDDLSRADGEVKLHNDVESNDSLPGPEHEIQWHYLTFDTVLPSPAYLIESSASLHGRQQPTQCPNLKRYTSPFLWSERRKRFMTFMSCICTICSAYSAGAYTSGLDQMKAEWHVSKVAIYVGVTTFTCGFGIAPMFLAPFSEINGRRPIFIITGWLFVAMQLTCGLTPTYAGMIVARFLVGAFASTFSTMVGGVVSDIYHAKDRNTAMALFAGSALCGTGLGPLVSGFIAQHITWRWIFYLQVIICGIVQISVQLFFQETRGSILLSRKAKTLNKWYDQLESEGYYGVMMPPTEDSTASEKLDTRMPARIRWKVKADEERASVLTMVSISLYRPFHLLVREPTVFFFSLWISFCWAVLYLTFSAVPLIFETHHGFNTEQVGAVFASITVGSFLSTGMAIYQERILRRLLPARLSPFMDTPEGRLCACCVQSTLLPIGLFWLGWTSFRGIPWIVPTLAVACATMGVYSVYLAVFNYLADIYGRYASSALAAQSFCRNMLAGVFPLVCDQMYNAMTYQGASSFLGGVAILLSIVPWVLVLYGPKIRARGKFAREGL